MGALVAVRHDPEMGAFYHRLLSRGKRNEQALVAVAQKLTVGDTTASRSFGPATTQIKWPPGLRSKPPLLRRSSEGAG